MDATTLFSHWKDVRAGLVLALDKLTDAQLDFVPRAGLWSLRETVCHIAGAEEGWLRHYVTNAPDWAAFGYAASNYPTVAALKALLAEVHARTEAQFADDADARLTRLVALPWGPQVSLEWAVWHVLEHEIHHRGEVYLMLGLMGMEAPDV
jgi:uncharacterized damage-inducible protein DinB